MPNVLRHLLMSALLFGIWLLLSGKFDPLHVVPGLFTAGIVAYGMRRAERRVFPLVRFLGYFAWLVGQIVLSNLRVARIVFSPDPDISPRLLRLRPDVEGDRALAMLGCSITLTPGTLAIEVSPDEILVHALDESSAMDVQNGVIAKRVARLFRGEPRELERRKGPAT